MNVLGTARKIILAIWIGCGLFPASGTGYDLCIDPGHGGDDPGTLTFMDTLPEKQINLQVALALD